MHFTDDQLENEPELRPRTWKTEKAFEQERLFLLNRLADNLHADVSSIHSSTSMNTSSSAASVISSTSETIAVDPDQTPRSNSSAFPSTLASSFPSTPRSVSSFFSNSSGSISRTSIASLESGHVPHTPIVFDSPPVSTFSFKTANPSPMKADSVVGSPMKLLRSPSIFKRRNKKIEKKDNQDEGSVVDVIKDGGLLDFFKNTAEGDQTTNTDHLNDSDDSETVKDFTGTESDGSIDSQGKEYVVERLGLGVVAEPQPVERQYRFVKRQIEKARQKIHRQKVKRADS